MICDILKVNGSKLQNSNQFQMVQCEYNTYVYINYADRLTACVYEFVLDLYRAHIEEYKHLQSKSTNLRLKNRLKYSISFKENN